ncbi:MAG: ribosome small subunit-dependent GTPase A [Planctomycetota bacterium]
MNEREKIYKRARKIRKANASEKRAPRHRPDYQHWDGDQDDDPGVVRMKPRGRGTLDDFVDQVLEHERVEEGAEASPASAIAEGAVVHIELGRCDVVLDDGGPIHAELPEHIRTEQRTALTVGDRVTVSAEHRVVDVLPRRTSLSRPDPKNRHLDRVIAANVDAVVIVAAVESPPLRPNLIDRYLIAIERGGARPIICASKTDLLEPGCLHEKLALLEEHRSLGYPVIPISAETGEGIEALRLELEGLQAVLVGHSGVGKSSLLNALSPELELRTGDVTGHAGKGRHTTTSSTLHDLGRGTRIIDTPGIRSFGLHQLGAEELPAYFPEIDEHSIGCRFRDCTHRQEPQCAVRDAAERGVISKRRYRLYLQLHDEIVR